MRVGLVHPQPIAIEEIRDALELMRRLGYERSAPRAETSVPLG
jgi:hypothetical protein